MYSIVVCYLLKLNKGSEWLLGENAFLTLDKKSYIITSKHQLSDDFYDGRIGQFSYKRKNGKIAVIGIFGNKSEPTTPMGFRFDYFIWSLKVYALIGKRTIQRKISHINFAQVATPLPKSIKNSKRFQFGPVGGQGPWYKVQFLPLKYRLINYVIYTWVYRLVQSRIKSLNVIFVHPILAERFGFGNIKPAIQIQDKSFTIKNKKPQIIHVSRRVYFKLPDLHKRLFLKLAYLHPELDFLVVGAGWGEEVASFSNLRFIDSLQRDEIIELFAESLFHINLSLELAGIVNLEAALNKCITIGSKNSGAEYLLGLTSSYVLDVYDSEITFHNIVEQISKLIVRYDKAEAGRQFEEAQKYTFIAN